MSKESPQKKEECLEEARLKKENPKKVFNKISFEERITSKTGTKK